RRSSAAESTSSPSSFSKIVFTQAPAFRPVSSGRFGMLGNQRLDHFGNLLLLAARQFGSFLENLLQSALGGLFLGFGRAHPQQLIHTDAERLGQWGKDTTARRPVPSFPKSDVGLRHAEFGG